MEINDERAQKARSGGRSHLVALNECSKTLLHNAFFNDLLGLKLHPKIDHSASNAESRANSVELAPANQQLTGL